MDFAGASWAAKASSICPVSALSLVRHGLLPVVRHSPVPENGKELCGSDLIAESARSCLNQSLPLKIYRSATWSAIRPRSANAIVALRDVIAREARNFARKAVDVVRGRQIVQGDEIEEFWALKDVSFEVKQGEVVGIIGRNGAGKSTLLKILSSHHGADRRTCMLRGRVASLLEVGTGFHPELTGRENIFLNGAILGMTRQEIRKKFDEIVAFAEVERFLDTPVKRYSSGMYVRLAFAVAAHLEPEILIVDEVLAVGDAEFQKKCLGKMNEIALQDKRTVLIVSHNLDMINRLCNRAILLNQGSIISFGDTASVVGCYLSKQNQPLRASWVRSESAAGS